MPLMLTSSHRRLQTHTHTHTVESDERHNNMSGIDYSLFETLNVTDFPKLRPPCFCDYSIR